MTDYTETDLRAAFDIIHTAHATAQDFGAMCTLYNAACHLTDRLNAAYAQAHQCLCLDAAPDDLPIGFDETPPQEAADHAIR